MQVMFLAKLCNDKFLKCNKSFTVVKEQCAFVINLPRFKVACLYVLLIVFYAFFFIQKELYFWMLVYRHYSWFNKTHGLSYFLSSVSKINTKLYEIKFVVFYYSNYKLSGNPSKENKYLYNELEIVCIVREIHCSNRWDGNTPTYDTQPIWSRPTSLCLLVLKPLYLLFSSPQSERRKIYPSKSSLLDHFVSKLVLQYVLESTSYS
jgi:hypothetical protein